MGICTLRLGDHTQAKKYIVEAEIFEKGSPLNSFLFALILLEEDGDNSDEILGLVRELSSVERREMLLELAEVASKVYFYVFVFIKILF